MTMRMRLNKFLARCGIASRRRCDGLIEAGQVTINGVVVTEKGICFNDDDEIRYQGEIVRLQSRDVYLMLNKPKGYLVSAKDTHDRRTVFDLLQGIPERVFPIGRLDQDTEGLLLFTNDGNFAHRLAHPKYNVKKIYHALVEGTPPDEALERLRQGVELEDFTTSPARVKVIRKRKTSAWLEIKIHEGKKREVRRMCAAVNLPVIELKRVAIDGLTLGDLPIGKWRYLRDDEIERLKKRINYDSEVLRK